MPREIQRIEDIEEILINGQFNQLIGLVENEILDAKGAPWNLADKDEKIEFAKDTSAFANLRGGVIIIGASTVKPANVPEERISDLRWLPESLNSTDIYYNLVRDWIYPQLEGFKATWYENPINDKRGIIAIRIPDQDESRKPFLVLHLLESGKRNDAIFGLAQRQGARTSPVTKEQLHSYIRNGRGWDPIVQKLDAILTRIEEK